MKYQNVLIIDDDQDDREIFLEAVKDVSSHINCIPFSDGETALEKLKQKAIMADAIFLDLNMPRMTGMEFLQHTRNNETLKNIPIIVYSTSSYIEATRLNTAGATDFITKPDNYYDLVQILRNHLVQADA